MSEEKIGIEQFAEQQERSVDEVIDAIRAAKILADPRKDRIKTLSATRQVTLIEYWQKDDKGKKSEASSSAPPKVTVIRSAPVVQSPTALAPVAQPSPSPPPPQSVAVTTKRKNPRQMASPVVKRREGARKIGATEVTSTSSRRAKPPRPPLDQVTSPVSSVALEASLPHSPSTNQPVQPESPPTTLSGSERLYQMQVERQSEQRKEEAAKKAAAVAAMVKKTTPEKSVAPAKVATSAGEGSTKITIDEKAVRKHQKKRKQSISRSAAREKTAENQHIFQKPTAPVVREVKIPEAISVSRLASEMSLKSNVLIRKLMGQGINVTANEMLDRETSWIIVDELGHRPVEALQEDLEEEVLKRHEDGQVWQPRAPVVTVMGHVDHGKTSLLDYIRQARVAAGEAGGITQHIGAYRVDSSIGPVTFIDTPGHALFTQMRARGASTTDIVVLVVAADDGVKQQTVEAINHAEAAAVPVVVAVNKIDKPDADLDRVKSQLSNYKSVLPEDWGGDAIVVPVSATTGGGIEQLLDALATQAELLELKAPIDVPASGIIVEARMEKGRGVVATVIVMRGVLKRGDIFVCDAESGRIRAMWNATKRDVSEAYPSEPVEVQGLSGVPAAGSELRVVDDERKARDVADIRQDKLRNKRLSRKIFLARESVETILDDAHEAEDWKELKIVIKADVEGSREALVTAFSAISGKKAGVKVIHSAVGSVTESDIYLAQASDGIVVAFNVRPSGKSRVIAESRNVRIVTGSVVYELEEKVRASVLNLLPPIIEERVVGVARIATVFTIGKSHHIAGSHVTEGAIRLQALVRVVRNKETVHEGKIVSLKHFKEDVKEVRIGSECGIGISQFDDIRAGDTIEVLERTEFPSEM